MRVITFVLLSASLCLAADPAPAPQPERFPIAQTYMTLFNGLIQNMQAVQRQVQEAEEKLRKDICGEQKIDVKECEVNWQQGSVSKKVAASAVPRTGTNGAGAGDMATAPSEQPKPTAAPAAKTPEKK